MSRGAMILCGGRSSRMGRDKASLPFGAETMLQRVVRRLAEVVPTRRMVVVAAADQRLPTLPADVTLAHDHRPERGPLEGLAAGLMALAPDVEAAYVSSCDVPLLVPAFVERLFAELGDCDIAVPRDAEHHHPLAAVYRPSVLSAVQRLLAADRLSPRFLFDEVPTRELPVNELRNVDPELRTLRNLNTPDEYHAALSTAKL
jgi:molybdopterin-guanine dinucleotide biosynthesis protein A